MPFTNYIGEWRNGDPTSYFLQRLYDFDAQLVVMPSMYAPNLYVLARKKQFGPGLTDAAVDATYANPDTKMCIVNGCVPVCIMTHVSGRGWDPESIITKLKARDLWAHGGADKVADMLDAQDEAATQAMRKATRDDLYARSGEGWRSYQRRTGQSSQLYHDRSTRTTTQGTLPEPVSETPDPVSDSSSTAGLGNPPESPETRLSAGEDGT